MCEDFHPAPLSGAWDSALLGSGGRDQRADARVPAPHGVGRQRGGRRGRLCAEAGDAAARALAPPGFQGAASPVGCPYLLLDAGFAQPAALGTADIRQRDGRPGARWLFHRPRRRRTGAAHAAAGLASGALQSRHGSGDPGDERAVGRAHRDDAGWRIWRRWPSWHRPGSCRAGKQQPIVWRQLIARRAAASQPLLLRQAQLRGLQLLARDQPAACRPGPERVAIC